MMTDPNEQPQTEEREGARDGSETPTETLPENEG